MRNVDDVTSSLRQNLSWMINQNTSSEMQQKRITASKIQKRLKKKKEEAIGGKA